MQIGLVLSGGGVKGAAHIGVLKALEEENRKYLRNMYELQEQSCLNRLNARMDCYTCTSYGTSKCMHPEKIFPAKRI